VVVFWTDRDGSVVNKTTGRRRLGVVGTTVEVPRGWRECLAVLPDGTELYGSRRWRWTGAATFTFDRVLPPGTEIIVSGRSRAREPGTNDDRQWWERARDESRADPDR